ncbi:hypothetical protein BDN70DRAFT_876053 [Pholiota conissans]|uniref:Uncharacterized protein n=1 Tax=Pholiota conissans TaxID=109636 RepID=A0A9P5Z602_9AGAR|nr:hypothetical protein BDN70DRAFT_876053 [Pholiota conissans]
MPIQPHPVGPKSLLSSGACILLSVADSRTCRIGVAVICSRMTEFPALKISFHSIRRNPAVQDSSFRRSVLLALLLPLPHILSGQIEKPQPIGCVGFASRAAGGLARRTQEESSTHSRARVPQILRRLQKTYDLSTSRQAVGHVVTPKYVDVSYRRLVYIHTLHFAAHFTTI